MVAMNKTQESQKTKKRRGVLGGSLCIFNGFKEIRADLWVMKDYGVRESWSKLFTISQSSVGISLGRLRLLRFSENGEVLLETIYSEEPKLVLYNPKLEKANTLEVHGVTEWYGAEVYVGSLVSLKSGTYVGQEQEIAD